MADGKAQYRSLVFCPTAARFRLTRHGGGSPVWHTHVLYGLNLGELTVVLYVYIFR